MFSINNLRIGSITPTDYFLGSVPIQKMYLGRICVFDRTEAERTVYTFAANSSTVTGNANGGSTEIQIQSYKETYVGDTPQGDIARVSLTNTWMSQFPDWCTPSVKSDSSNTTWTITLNFEENTSSDARQVNVTLTQQESNKQVTLTVKQEAGNVTAQYILNVQPTEATLTGTDADKSTTFTVNTYKQQVINGEVQPTKTHVTCSFDSGTGGEEGVSISSKNNNNGTYTVTVTCMSSTQNQDYPIIVTQAESSKTATFTLHKVDPSITYSDITITTFTYPDTVSAAGETVTPTLAYSQTYGYDGATTGGGTITSGATVIYSGTGVNTSTGQVTIESKGTTLSGETTASEVTVTVSMNGKSATETFTIKQAANTRTSELTDGVFTTAYSDFPAKGMNKVGWDRLGNCTHRPRAHWNYTSGAIEDIDGSINWINGTNFVIPDLGTTPTARHRVLVWEEPDGEGMYGPYDQWVWEDDDNDKLTNYKYAPELWQEENRIESTDYGDWTIEVTGTMQVQPSGGTLHFNPTISRTVTNTYTSEAVEETTENDNDNYTLSSNQTWAVVSDKSVVVSANDGEDRSAIITLTSHEVSKQITITQSSGTEITTYGDITITGGQASDIPASGGTSKATGYTISQQVTYSNGEQETIDLTAYADVTEVSADSLGTTVKDRTKVGTSVISVSNGDKEASKSIDVYQQANAITGTTYKNAHITLEANPMTIPAAGGTSELTTHATRTATHTYTSGDTKDEEQSSAPYTTISGEGFSLSASSAMTITITATKNNGAQRTATITSKAYEVTETLIITQESGQTITSYGEITITEGTVSDIPASGGEMTVTNYKATQNVTYASTQTGTIDVTGQCTTTTIEGQNLGTTIKERTLLGQAKVNCSANGKTATKSYDVYQAANTATYGEVTGGTATANDILASGGTVQATVTKDATQTVSYTSGSTRNGNVTNSATEVSAASLGTTVKGRTQVGTSIMTFTGEGGKSQKVTVAVYQQANEKITGDITYGDWQVSISANPTSVPNSGGTSTITRSAYRSRTQNYSYTSKATSTEKLSNETATPTLSSNQTWAVIQDTTVTISANNADTSRTVTITASHEGKQATCTITQGASVKVYSDLNVTGLTFKQLPASGIAQGQHVAQNYVTGGTVTQTWGWNTTTGGGTLTWNLPADISQFTSFDVQIANTVPSLGTTEREEHTINDIFTVAISQNGKTYNASYDGVQEANVKTPGDKRYNEDIYDTKQNANISPESPWEFDVGTVKTKFRLGVPTYQKYTYTSGSESEEKIADTVVIPNSVSFVKSGTNTPVEWVHSRTAIFDDPDYEYRYTVDNNGTGRSRTVDVLLYAVYPDQSLVTKLPITIHITQNAAPAMEYVTGTVSNIVLNDAPASGISLQNSSNSGYNIIPNPSKYLKSCMVTISWRYEGREDIMGNIVKYYPGDQSFLGSPIMAYCQYNTDAQNRDNTFVKNIDEKGTTVSGRSQIPYYVRVQFTSIDNSNCDVYGYSSVGAWYQQANQVESTSEEQGDKTVTKFEINNGTHTVNPQSGTLELQAVCSQTITTVKTYTSGAIGREQSTNSTLKPASLESSQSWLTVPSIGSISWDSGKNAYTGNVSITANSSTSTRTAEVRCYPDSGKPSVYESITITQNGKTSTDSYGWWNFDEVKANTQSVTAAGGTITLSGNAKRTVTHNWSDGTQTTSTETKPLSECTVTVDNGATVSSNKTAVTIPVNQTTSAKSYTITMSVYGGGSNIKELTINQSADTYDSSDDTYGDWTVSVSASPQTIAYTGGTSTITRSATRTVTHHWVSGRTTNEQESGTPTLSGSATGFSLSGTTLTAQSNISTYGGQTLTKDNDLSDVPVTPEGILAYTVNSYVDRSITASRSITITATMGTKTNTVKVTQSGDPGGRTYYKPKTKTVQSGFEVQIEESTYEENKYDVLIGVSKSNDNAFGTSYNQKLNTTVTITTDYPNSKTLDLACGWTRFYIDGVPTKVELSPSNNNSSSFELTSNGKWTIS